MIIRMDSNKELLELDFNESHSYA